MQHTIVAIISLASAFLTSIAVIIWSIRQPELREGWRAVFKRIKEAREAQYDPEDITAFFREYWIIIGEMADTNCLDRLTNLTMDMEIFQRKFHNKVPGALFDSKMLSLIQRYDIERKRVMYMNAPKKN